MDFSTYFTQTCINVWKTFSLYYVSVHLKCVVPRGSFNKKPYRIMHFNPNLMPLHQFPILLFHLVEQPAKRQYQATVLQTTMVTLFCTQGSSSKSAVQMKCSFHAVNLIFVYLKAFWFFIGLKQGLEGHGSPFWVRWKQYRFKIRVCSISRIKF